MNTSHTEQKPSTSTANDEAPGSTSNEQSPNRTQTADNTNRSANDSLESTSTANQSQYDGKILKMKNCNLNSVTNSIFLSIWNCRQRNFD